MAAGLHVAVYELGRAQGIPLALGRAVPWLTGRGHFNDLVQQQAPTSVVGALADIHRALGGNASALATKRGGNPPTPDLIHVPTGRIIEVDEVQHFTTARGETFDHYPSDTPLGFDDTEYRDLITTWHPKADRAFAHKVSTDFPQVGGRQAQRAYNDALRDLLAPVFTHHPVIRIPVPNRTLDTALERLQVALAATP